MYLLVPQNEKVKISPEGYFDRDTRISLEASEGQFQPVI